MSGEKELTFDQIFTQDRISTFSSRVNSAMSRAESEASYFNVALSLVEENAIQILREVREYKESCRGK